MFLSALACKNFVGSLQHVGVERSGQSAIAGDQDQQNVVLGPLFEQRMLALAGLLID